MESLSSGFWIDNLLAVCRTGEPITFSGDPKQGATPSKLKGDGFYWYDTNMEHIMTRATFRNCGWDEVSPNAGGCGVGGEWL